MKNTPSQTIAKDTQDTGLREKSLEALKKFRQIVSSAQQHFRQIEDQCGLSGAQLWALREIAEKPGLRVSDLARAMSVHQSTASNLLDRLTKHNLVRRERNNTDQRIVHLYITAEGARIVACAPQPERGVLPDALNRMPDETLDDLNRSLALLLDSMAIKDEDAAMKPLSDLMLPDTPPPYNAQNK